MMNKEVGSDDCSADDALLHQPKHQPKLSQTSSSPCMKRKGLDISDGPPLPKKRYTRPDLQDKADRRQEEQNHEDSSELQKADESPSSEKNFVVHNSRTREISSADGYTYLFDQGRPTEEQSRTGSIPSLMEADTGPGNDNLKGGCFPQWDHVKEKFMWKGKGRKEAATNLGRGHNKK